MQQTVYIGIGSNLGNREKNCTLAVEAIGSLKETRVVAVSPWYKNPALTPSPDEKQPDYRNGAVQIETTLAPVALLDNLQKIEREMGRPSPHPKWSPRIIDLDLLIYDTLIIKTEELTLPHPEMAKRIFVLKPLCDIAPGLIHPELKLTVAELLAQFKES